MTASTATTSAATTNIAGPTATGTGAPTMLNGTPTGTQGRHPRGPLRVDARIPVALAHIEDSPAMRRAEPFRRGTLAVQDAVMDRVPYIRLAYDLGSLGAETYLLAPDNADAFSAALAWHLRVADGTADPDAGLPRGAEARSDATDLLVATAVPAHAPFRHMVGLRTARPWAAGPGASPVVLSVVDGELALTAHAARRLLKAVAGFGQLAHFQTY